MGFIVSPSAKHAFRYLGSRHPNKPYAAAWVHIKGTSVGNDIHIDSVYLPHNHIDDAVKEQTWEFLSRDIEQ